MGLGLQKPVKSRILLFILEDGCNKLIKASLIV